MFKEINKIRLESYRVPAIREYLHSADEAFAACETVRTQMPLAYPQWRTDFENMKRIYEISLKSKDTAEIHNLDDRRDNLTTAIRAAANNYRKALNDETRRHGIAVWDALNSFRVDIEAQYNIQTAQLDSLIGVLLAEPLRADVEALGLLPLIEELKSLNDRLHELVTQRDNENIDKPDRQRQEALAAAIDSYRWLVKYINAYYLINVVAACQPDDSLEHCIDLINSIIVRYRRNFKMGGAGDSDSEDSEGNVGDEGEGEDSDENEGSENGGSDNTGGTTDDTEEDWNTDDDYGFDEDLK